MTLLYLLGIQKLVAMYPDCSVLLFMGILFFLSTWFWEMFNDAMQVKISNYSIALHFKSLLFIDGMCVLVWEC